MSSFTTPLELEYIDGDNWRLTAGFEYDSVNDWKIIVPAGFVTDFASIPRLLWNIVPPAEGYGKAAVIHDYLYRYTPDGPNKTWWSRRDADGVFLEAMGVLAVPAWKKWPIWLAVRVFGGRAFKH